MKIHNNIIYLVALLFIGIENGLAAPQPRIAGGSVASIQQYPFSTALLHDTLATGTFTQSCGGSILSRTAILSAASCFHNDGEPHLVSWWRSRVGSGRASSGGLVHLVRLITSHPDFDWASGEHDLAVLSPSISISFGDSVGAVQIAAPLYTLSTNEVVQAIGWGITRTQESPSEELREVQVWVVNQDTCRSRWAAAGVTVTDDVVCAGWLDVGVRGQCQGDVGSPLLQAGVVVGVHSRSEGCADGWLPDLNTRVAPYSLWIYRTVNGL